MISKSGAETLLAGSIDGSFAVGQWDLSVKAFMKGQCQKVKAIYMFPPEGSFIRHPILVSAHIYEGGPPRRVGRAVVLPMDAPK